LTVERRHVIKEIEHAEGFVSFFERLLAVSMTAMEKFISEYTDLVLGQDISIKPVYDFNVFAPDTPTTVVVDIGPLANASVTFPDPGNPNITIRYKMGPHQYMLSGTVDFHFVSLNELFAHRTASAFFSFALLNPPFFEQYDFLSFKPTNQSSTIVLPDESGSLASAKYDVTVGVEYLYSLVLNVEPRPGYPTLNGLYFKIKHSECPMNEFEVK